MDLKQLFILKIFICSNYQILIQIILLIKKFPKIEFLKFEILFYLNQIIHLNRRF